MVSTQNWHSNKRIFEPVTGIPGVCVVPVAAVSVVFVTAVPVKSTAAVGVSVVASVEVISVSVIAGVSVSKGGGYEVAPGLVPIGVAVPSSPPQAAVNNTRVSAPNKNRRENFFIRFSPCLKHLHTRESRVCKYLYIP